MLINGVKLHTTLIKSEFTQQERAQSLTHSEKTMHNQEQQLTVKYFKEISETVLTADKILLFGPKVAKQELWNTLKEDHLFDEKKIAAETCVHFNEAQQLTFFKDYFELG